MSAFSFVGALVTAFAIYLLAWRNGVAGYRLVLVGIGIAAMLYGDRLPDDPGEHLGRPGRAALADRQPQRMRLERDHAAAADLAAGVPAAHPVGRRTALTGLQLGDDTATGIGIRVERSRLLLIVFGVGAGRDRHRGGRAGRLRRLRLRADRPPADPRYRHRADPGRDWSAPLVVCLADFVGQHAFPVQLPVGMLTAAVGAPYLLYLLVVSNRVGNERLIVMTRPCRPTWRDSASATASG